MMTSSMEEEMLEMLPLGGEGHSPLSSHEDEEEEHSSPRLGTFRILKLTLLFFSLVFSFSGFLLSIVDSTCWTAKQELELLTRFDKDYGAEQAGPWPLEKAHSHNDYLQAKPLTEALSAGFCSLEVDIDESLQILDLSKSLESIYLIPLIEVLRKNKGYVFQRAVRLRTCTVFTLLIEFKPSEVVKENSMWEDLENLISKLDSDSTIFEIFGEESKSNPIRVVLSGIQNSKEIAQMMSSRRNKRTSLDLNQMIDVSKEELENAKWISMLWENENGQLVNNDAIQNAVFFSQEHKLLLRYRNTPDDFQVWDNLIRQGVAKISTKSLYSLNAFLLGRTPEK